MENVNSGNTNTPISNAASSTVVIKFGKHSKEELCGVGNDVCNSGAAPEIQVTVRPNENGKGGDCDVPWPVTNLRLDQGNTTITFDNQVVLGDTGLAIPQGTSPCNLDGSQTSLTIHQLINV